MLICTCLLLWWLTWTAVQLPCASFPFGHSYLRPPVDTEWAQGKATNAVCPGTHLTLGNSEKPSGLGMTIPNYSGDTETTQTEFKSKCSFSVQETWYNQFTLGLQKYLRPSFPNEHVLELFNPQKGTPINIIMFGPIPDKHKFSNTRISHGTKCLHLFALLLQRVGKNPKHKYINLQIISAFRWKDGGIKTLNSDWSKDKEPVTHPNYSQEPGILTLCPLL